MPETLAPQLSPAERDLQRAALRALVELSERCAAREIQIEQQHAAALDAANKELDKTNWGVEERFKNQLDAIKQKYEGRISAAEGKYKTDFDALKHADSLARQRLDHEKNAIDRDVKKGFEQAAWLAESVFDAAQIGINEEFKKVNDRIAEELKALNEMEHTAAGLMQLYRQKPPPDEELRDAEKIPAAVGSTVAPTVGPDVGSASADRASAPSTDAATTDASPVAPVEATAATPAPTETLQEFYTKQHQTADQL